MQNTVNIYDVDPNYITCGYTPGYLNSVVRTYVVLYGTGFIPNHGPEHIIITRPWSWGFISPIRLSSDGDLDGDIVELVS